MKLPVSLTGFAEACYDQNTVEELIEALMEPVDRFDCAEWKLSDDEWKEAIGTALMMRIIHRERLGVEA